MPYTRIVLKPHATTSNVLVTGNIKNGKTWKTGSSTLVKADEPHVTLWKGVDGGCVIAYMQDPLREIRYYHLTGTSMEPHIASIRRWVPCYERPEIEAMMAAAGAPAEKTVALYHAAASAPPEPDPAILDFLTRSLADAEPSVRRTAVDATLMTFWPDLRGPLERVVAADPDAELQAFAKEALAALQTRVWAAAPGSFDFAPLPPDKARVTPLTGIGDDWYEKALGRRPVRPGVASAPIPSRKPEFQFPDWLVEMMRQGDWAGVRWHSAEQIRTAASQCTEFSKLTLMDLSQSHLNKNRALWESMVPLGDGPEFTDRGGRTEKSRLFVNRDDPQGLLLSLGPDHPPALWAPAGRTRAEIETATASYFFPGIPPQAELPFQGRLFLITQSMLRGEFVDLERRVESSPFTDTLPWGSSQATDPWPERVTLGRIPLADLQRFTAKDPSGLPRTSIRTRYSRSVIQLIDWQNGYFADLFFRPTPPLGWTTAHNAKFATDFPPGTPVDVVGALSGLACIGPEQIRPQAEAATEAYQRKGMEEIIGFLEQARLVQTG